MADQVWRPLGVDTEDDVAEYDALHDGIPGWMETAFWGWVQRTITFTKSVQYQRFGRPWPEPNIIESMCLQLRIPMAEIRYESADLELGRRLIINVMSALKKHQAPMQIADYLLAHSRRAKADDLEEVLESSKSAWSVGSRNGWRGLVRRVPEGVQVAADDVMSRSGRAGIRLAKAWEQLYGVDPNPSDAYRLAILAVEDAAVPVVSPKDDSATLGKIIGQLNTDTKWTLPMEREEERAPSNEVLVSMMRVLWHGQHDRHGGQNSELEGQPSEPGNVSLEEATVAVSLAVTLVNLFHAGIVARETKS